LEIAIPLSNIEHLDGILSIPASPKVLIIFAHGSGSGRDSPRNQRVANTLNQNGFATLLADLLTPMERDSDTKSQKVMGRFPGIVLNKFNIPLLSNRLFIITDWAIWQISKVKGLPIGYFGASTGVAAAIESAVSNSYSEKTYAIVSSGGRPDLTDSDTLKRVNAATMLIVGAKDSKDMMDLTKKAFKQLKNAKSKDLVIVPDAGHLFDEFGAIERVANVATQWFTRTL
jgi:dienelactone hydrolase